MGTSRTPTPRAAVSSAVTSLSVAPSVRRWVRNRCVARSRSPSWNQLTPPNALRFSETVQVSCATPHPVVLLSRPASAYVTLSMSGLMWSPCNTRSSPVLITAVISAGSTTVVSPANNLAAPTPPAKATSTHSAYVGTRGGPEPRRRLCKARPMSSTPPSRQGSSKDGSLRVALDATPLIGHRTGVGEFCLGALGGLAERTDVSVSAFAVSWRRRDRVQEVLPRGVSHHQRAMPARPLHWSWRRLGLPAAEWFLGQLDV